MMNINGSIMKGNANSIRKRVGFIGGVDQYKEKRVVFKITCEAIDEHHAVTILLNSHLKYEDKIIKQGVKTVIEVSQEFDKFHKINNDLTLID